MGAAVHPHTKNQLAHAKGFSHLHCWCVVALLLLSHMTQHQLFHLSAKCGGVVRGLKKKQGPTQGPPQCSSTHVVGVVVGWCCMCP